MKRWGLLGAICFSVVFAADLLAGEVKLTWKANSESDLSGYNVYCGKSSRRYGPPVKAGKSTTCTLSNLEAGTTYYFAITALDTSGNESGYSAEIKAAPKAAPKAATKAATSSSAPGKVKASVALWWTTDKNRSSTVPVEIYDGSTLLAKVKVNQKGNGGKWNTLGSYTFSNAPKVVVVANGTGTVCADALMITGPDGSKVIVDNGKANTSQTGTWKVSSGANYYGSKSVFAKDNATYTFKAK
jgi:hypothetical protein